jgi:hydroxymethylpyrimidine pyrophosphatase-like HAD family hydrolase
VAIVRTNLALVRLPSAHAVLDYAPPASFRERDQTTIVFFKALAFDFDGTLASNDRIGPGVREALERARQAELRLILVTGRTFFELSRVCDCLQLFDAVVAENGAVLYYPGSAMIRNQGPPPPTRLLAELDRRGIPYQVGRVIVGAARTDEVPIREALATVGVDRDLVYNRAALMLLPAGVSKGSGVQNALRSFGVSFHDVLAFGDAENDLPLFEVSGWRACPADAMPVVKERADWVFPGENGAAVAAAVEGSVLQGLLPVQFSARHRIPIGWAAETSEPVAIAARGVNVLVHGDPLSGKSWLAGALVERLVAARYSVCVIDPEGDYQVLSRLAAVTWAAIRSEQDLARLFTRLERNLGASVVADLSALPHARKVDVIEAGLRAIGDLRRRLGRPHWVLLDEAHYSLHREGVAEEALGIEERGFCLVTYLPSWLRERVVKAMDVYLLSRVTAPDELAFLSVSLPDIGSSGNWPATLLPQLPRGKFVVAQPDPSGAPTALTFVAAARETMHVRHVKKYADSHVPPEQRFFFRDHHGRVVAEAESLHGFRHAVVAVPLDVLAYHAGRGDFARWVLDVFADRELARELEKSVARWRRGEIPDLGRAIDRLILNRYGPES